MLKSFPNKKNQKKKLSFITKFTTSPFPKLETPETTKKEQRETLENTSNIKLKKKIKFCNEPLRSSIPNQKPRSLQKETLDNVSNRKKNTKLKVS